MPGGNGRRFGRRTCVAITTIAVAAACTLVAVAPAASAAGPDTGTRQSQLVNQLFPYSDQYRFNVLVEPTPPFTEEDNLNPPTGFVHIAYNGVEVGSAEVQQTEGQPCQVQADIAAQPPTSETAVTITYPGDDYYTSADLSFDIDVSPTLVVHVKSGLVSGQHFVVHGRVTGLSGQAAPTGAVYLDWGDGNPPVEADLDASGDFAVADRLPAGDYELSASYSGDGYYAAKTKRPVEVTVGRASTSTTVSKVVAGSGGDRVVAKVAVLPPGSSGGPLNDGTVALDVNGSTVAATAVTDGKAVFTHVAVPPGASVEADYSGTVHYAPSSGTYP